MGKQVCIVCGQEKGAYPVEDDIVLRSIRSVKQATHSSTGNVLMVCADDVETARAKRSRFEKTAMTYAALGACVLLISLFAGAFPMSVAYGFLGMVFVMSLSLVSYYPRAALPKAQGGKAAGSPAPPKEGSAGTGTGG